MFLVGVVVMSISCTSEPADGLLRGAPDGAEVAVRRLDHDPATARVGGPLAADGPTYLYATDNDGTRYALEVTVGAPVESWAYLRLGEDVWSAETVSRTPAGSVVGFALDPDSAERAAALFGVPKASRVPLDAGLAATFEPDPASGPTAIVARRRNVGGEPLTVQVGGGARDESFSFRIARADGTDVPIPPAMGFGAPRSRVPFGRDAEVAVPADLSRWVDLPPGTYTVRVAYRAELAPADAPLDATDRHRRWDWTPTGEVALAVGAP